MENGHRFMLSALILSSSVLGVLALLLLPELAKSSASIAPSTCVSFNEETSTIVISCDATFEDVKSVIIDQSLLTYDSNDSYILNANIRVNDGATFNMCSCHISWLKILGQNHMMVYGRMEFEGIKITSWDLESNSFVQQDSGGSIARPWIMLDGSEGGFIRNSELGHLGYETDLLGRGGLSLHRASHDLELTNNEFHNIWFAFYSNGAYNIKIDGNEYHSNGLYALDPHTGTNAMQITNNHVHHNKGFGIICSLDCYDILIEGNEVNHNGNAGIMLSRNTHDSIVRRNNVHDHPGDDGIFVSQSPNNQILDNTLTNNLRAIYVKTSTSTGNVFEGNIISGGNYGMLIATADEGNIARNNSFFNVSVSEYYLTYGAGLVIDEQEFSETRIRAGNGTNIITIQNSEEIMVENSTFDTAIQPYTQALTHVSISVNSYDDAASSCDLQVTNPYLSSQFSGSVSTPTTDEQFTIAATITNPCSEREPFVAIIEVRNSEGVTEYLGWEGGILEGQTGQAAIGVSWIPSYAGTYELRTFAISSLDSPRILSTISSSEISITSSLEQI